MARGQLRRVAGDALRVRVGVAVLGIDGPGERVHGVHEARLHDLLGRLLGGEVEVALRRVDVGAVASVGLGPVHRAVGEVGELLERQRVARELRHPGAEGERLAGGAEAHLADLVAQPLDGLLGLVHVGAVEREHELVAAHAAADVAWPQLGAQGSAELAQRLVAGRVTPAVVDLLEVVDVHGDDRYGVALTLRAPKLLVEALLEGTVVEQAAQRVLQRKGLEVAMEAVQLTRHAVEVTRERADLVDSLPAELGLGLAAADALGRLAKLVQRRDDRVPEQPVEDQDERQGSQGGRGGNRALVSGEGRVEVREVVVQLHRGGGRPASSAQAAVELAVVHAVCAVDLVVAEHAPRRSGPGSSGRTSRRGRWRRFAWCRRGRARDHPAPTASCRPCRAMTQRPCAGSLCACGGC